MDGIEKITGRIAADAQKEADAILAEARRQAGEIAARYEAQAQKEREEIVARGRRNADERVERLAGVAQLDARKLELAAKQELLKRAYGLALEKLENLPDEQAVALLADLAVKASSTGREQVILSQKDRARLRQGGGDPGQREAGGRAPDAV